MKQQRSLCGSISTRRIKLEFHGARITSDGGLLAYRELNDAFGLTEIAITKLLEGRRGKNARHTLAGCFGSRCSGGSPLRGCQRRRAARLRPAMRAIVGREGVNRAAASSSQIGRLETEWLATVTNVEALTDLSGAWIDRVHERKPHHPRHGQFRKPDPRQQEGSV